MPELTANGIAIDDTFAEAFDMRATAIVITAPTERWAAQAATTMTGFATSVIACGCEASVESILSPQQTPDGRPGVRVLLFAVSTAELQKQLQNRVGQCVLTSPGSACYAGLDSGEDKLKLGDAIRFFGDGWQIAKRLGARRYWRVPVMDGEFVCESTTYLTKKAVGGGNLIIMGESPAKTLDATEAAVKAMRKVADVIMPFPGGIARSGSKVGSKYKGASASTNDALLSDLEGRGRQRAFSRNRLGARDRDRRPHQRGCRRGDASGACRDRRTGPRARRVARRRGQLRRQARPPPLSSQGSSAVSPLDLLAARGAGSASRSVAVDRAKSCRQDGRGDRTYRTANDAHACRGRRRFPHPRGRSRHNRHRRRSGALRSRRHGYDFRRHSRRRGSRRRSRAPDVGRTIDRSAAMRARSPAPE